MAERFAESYGHGVVGTDRAGLVTTFSPAAERLLGRRREEVLGEHFVDLLVPARLRDLARQEFERYGGGGSVRLVGQTLRVTALTGSGDERPLAMTITEVRADPDYFVACFSPEQGDLVHAAPGLTSIGAYTVDGSSGMVEMSASLWRVHGLLGQPAPMALSDYIRELVHPEDGATLTQRTAQRQVGDDVPLLQTWRIVTPAGEVRILLSEARVDYRADGSLERISGLVRDVTETEGTRRALLLYRSMNTALDGWDGPRGGVVGLLREVVTAMGWRSGALWRAVPDSDALECPVVWAPPPMPGEETIESVLRATRLRVGQGVPGRAWESRRVVLEGCDKGPPELAFPLMHGERPLAVLHFHAASGHVPSQELAQTLHETGRGPVAAFFGRNRADLGLSPLTDREQDVLQLAADGGALHTIAQSLGISTSTVKTHMEHVYTKLGASDRGGAVAAGFRQGLIR